MNEQLKGWTGLGLAVGFALSIQPLVARAADVETPRFRISLSDSSAARTLAAALDGARRRLERPRCQKLLTDFADASGRPLQHNLEALGQTPDSYLRLIRFVDGSNTTACRQNSAAAATMPGSRVVWVCTRRLLSHARMNRSKVEIALIHELLHTLGLGENPPTSGAITASVDWRCGGG